MAARTKSKTDRAIKCATSQAARVGDVTKLPEPLRTVALVHAAQGVIENGGFQYFFESDFPSKPSYALFVQAYRDTGAIKAGAALAEAVALFPFANPHLHATRRSKFMDSFKDEDGEAVNSPFERLTSTLYGDKDVWKCLDRYIELNAKALRV